MQWSLAVSTGVTSPAAPGIWLLFAAAATGACMSVPPPPEQLDQSSHEQGDGDPEGSTDSRSSTGTGLPRVLYQQDFENYGDTRLAADWNSTQGLDGTAPAPGRFQVAQVGDTRALATTTRDDFLHAHLARELTDAARNLELTGRVRLQFSWQELLDTASSGIGVTCFGAQPDGDIHYQVRYQNAQLRVDAHGLAQFPGYETLALAEAERWYRFRIQCVDRGQVSEVRARIWEDGASEPTDWTIQAADGSSTRLLSGAVGVYATGAGAKYWDDLTVTALPE